jgi:hypothetical protein
MRTIKTIFKQKSSLAMLLGIMSVLVFSSCEKETQNNITDVKPLKSEVVGTYTGTLKNSATNDSRPATITVTAQNDSLVRMHCFSNDFDSTITMQLYQNYDSIMMCFTGQDFYNEYGHNTNNYDFCYSKQSGWMNNGWMNDGDCWGNNNNNWGNNNWAGNEQWNAWTNHLNTQHNQNDLHYGGFNLSENSCNYSFNINIDGTSYSEVFQGVKNN